MATVTMTTGPRVAGGHVAAWVGVGGVGLGPNGTDQWLQVGFGSTLRRLRRCTTRWPCPTLLPASWLCSTWCRSGSRIALE